MRALLLTGGLKSLLGMRVLADADAFNGEICAYRLPCFALFHEETHAEVSIAGKPGVFAAVKIRYNSSPTSQPANLYFADPLPIAELARSGLDLHHILSLNAARPSRQRVYA